MSEEKSDSESDTKMEVRGTRLLSEIYERCNTALLESTNVEAASLNCWMAAMKELNMIKKNKIWELVHRPSNKKVIGIKWLYKTKLNSNGSVNKCKAVKGYSQGYGVDFSQTFALVARYDTIRL